MRRLFDRLLVALIPYTGLLTVSTCGGTPTECGETGDSKTVNMTAKVSSDIDLESSIDGAITDESWRCEGRVFARRDRAKDDTSLAPLPATAQIFCSIEDDGLTKATWSFTVPLEDLRAPAFAPEATTAVEVNRQDHRQPSAGCNAKVNARVASVLATEAGSSAAPPKYVTADFARRITTTIAFDGGGCGAMTGKIALDIELDASSFVEGDTPTCL